MKKWFIFSSILLLFFLRIFSETEYKLSRVEFYDTPSRDSYESGDASTYNAEDNHNFPKQPALAIPLGWGCISIDVRSIASLKDIVARVFGKETKQEKRKFSY